MLGSSFLDPVIGLDVHFEMVPTPAPVPTPVPNPFIGLVFDPLGLAAGIALGAVIGAVMGTPFRGPVLYWTAFPATNTGTEAKHVTGHILIPPGASWAPFPKTPKPVIHPDETPEPALPIKPENDAVVVFGSKTVSVMGSNAVRLGDIALSCSEPLRLPSSVVLAVPKGALILIGGPPSLDIMAAVLASLRTRFVSDSLHALISRLKPSRFRNLLHRGVCFLTGHPVDVASGKVVTGFVDAELPGSLPLTIERIYSSAFASRPGPFGYGWSLSLNQAVWRERGKVVLLAEDGREIEFDTFGLPSHQIAPGQSVYNPIERLTLHCDSGEVWRVLDHEGGIRQFGPIAGATAGVAVIYRTRSRCGFHEISYFYDERGRLAWVRDSGGRMVGLTYDSHGRLAELYLPNPEGEGVYCHRRYFYDGDGDLVEVVDSLGKSWRFAYATHLLTQETDRSGLSFYFAYDGLGEDAWCVRTWGDEGIYDHVMSYDKNNHVTAVTDSLNHTTLYRMNLVGQVVAVADPLGAETKYEYDPVTLQITVKTDAIGNITRFTYDQRGNRIRVENPDGTSVASRYHHQANLCIETVDARGGPWTWRYNGIGQLVEQRDPLGHIMQFEWARGKLNKITYPDSSAVGFAYDGANNLALVVGAGGAELRIESDARGWPRRTWIQGTSSELRRYDTEGNVLDVAAATGVRRCFRYDAEGNLTSATDGVRDIKLGYAGYHRLTERREGHRVERFVFDSEDNLVAMVNAAGEQARLEHDARGLPLVEHTFDGRTLHYKRDALGQVTGVRWSSGRNMSMSYDAVGRVTSESYSDGSIHSYRYGPDDMLCEASNEAGVVTFKRDALGRLLRESFVPSEGTPAWIDSRYQADGARTWVESSLGARQRIDRDSDGHPTELTVEAGVRWNALFERDIRGWETARTQDGIVYQHWKRDASGRPLERHLHAGRQLVRSEAITWTGDHQIGELSDSEAGARSLVHDDSGRLLGWRDDESSELRFTDDAGRVFRTRSGEDRDYGPGGRLERDGSFAFIHDDDGQRSERLGPEGSQRLHYDDRGWLREVEQEDGTTIAFDYDALGRRVRKRLSDADGTSRNSTTWIWDGDFLLHEIHEDQEPITWIHEPERWSLIAKLQGSESRSIVTDLAGAPTDLFDANGQRRWRMRLDLFGVPAIEGLASECPVRWPGQYADVETGLYYNRYRYYDPGSGQYLTPDPLGLAAGDRIWSYVDDPLLWIDPLGLCDFIALFRGTSSGYPGNSGVQLARRTPTSTNPAIATIFATQSSQHGNGVLHILSPSDLTNIRTGPGNVLAHLEAEIVVHALPRQARNRATVSISADVAREILRDMDIHVPGAIRDIAALDRAVRNAPHMSNNQIRKFLRRARERNTNPKCFR